MSAASETERADAKRARSVGDWLREGLYSRNGLMRKASAALLQVPKTIRRLRTDPREFGQRPPVLANSFPKSGTHLLVQVVDGLPNRVNYGEFLGSETSSFRFKERTPENTCRFIRRFVPGDIIRGHLFYDPRYARELAERNVVHYFIYRDPRAVVVSDAHYLRDMNRWHRLHQFYRGLSIEDAIRLAIMGLERPVRGVLYPDIGARFARYEGWMNHPDCFPVRFEDLVGGQRPELFRQMAEFYAARSSEPMDVEASAAAMIDRIAPEKSHTFRSGQRSGWRKEFTVEHRRLFDEVAGDLLIRLGYEPNHDWARAGATVESEPPGLSRRE